MKRILTLFIASVISVSIFAGSVGKSEATALAVEYIVYKSQGTIDTDVPEKIETFTIGADTAFYICHFNGGFVIVSANDAVLPVLGYSITDEFDTIHNSSLGKWLTVSAKKAIQQSETQDSMPHQRWMAYRDGAPRKKESVKVVSPLLTTAWGQDDGYNDYCPGTSITGCVATAMAQIMNYWEYPTTGVSKKSYYSADHGWLSADFGNTTYDWDNMPDSSASDASALLMYHCGVAVDMYYGDSYSGSGSDDGDVAQAIANFFQYSQDAEYLYKSDYTDEEWKSLIIDELDNSRPVMYGGYSSTSGGHAFVCDGYDEDTLFHFNWGWEGSGDGYYAIGSLSPEGEDFSDDNTIVTGFEPASDPKFIAARAGSDITSVASQAYPYYSYISAVDQASAWAIVADGSGNDSDYRIYARTEDGGFTWESKELTSFDGTAFAMIQGLTADIAFIALNDSVNKDQILKTSDGGETWTSILSGASDDSYFNVVHFFDENNGFVMGNPVDGEYEMYTTTDGGESWTSVASSNIPDPDDSDETGFPGCYDAVGDTIWFSCLNRDIYKSTDKGNTWERYTLFHYGPTYTTKIKPVFSDNGQDGLALVQVFYNGHTGYTRYKTTNGGETWSELTSYSGNFYGDGISAVPGTENTFYSTGWAYVSSDMGISYTTDGGDTWTDLPNYYKLYQFTTIAMVDTVNGYMGTCAHDYSGGMWKFGTDDGSDTPTPVYAVFFLADTLSCVNTDITFTSASTGDIDDYTWNFGDNASPSSATGEGPHTVQYTGSGYKTVSLEVSNSGYSDTYTMTNAILVADSLPVAISEISGNTSIETLPADEEYTVADQENTYFYWSVNTTASWDIEHDYGNTATVSFSNEKAAGDVVVQAFNGCGTGEEVSLTVNTSYSNVLSAEVNNDNISITPNPASERITVSADKSIQHIEIYSLTGKTLYTATVDAQEIEINISNFAKGTYTTQVTTGKGTTESNLLIVE